MTENEGTEAPAVVSEAEALRMALRARVEQLEAARAIEAPEPTAPTLPEPVAAAPVVEVEGAVEAPDSTPEPEPTPPTLSPALERERDARVRRARDRHAGAIK